MTRLEQAREKLEKLKEKRERNIDRYIIPVEIKIDEQRDRIRDLENKAK